MATRPHKTSLAPLSPPHTSGSLLRYPVLIPAASPSHSCLCCLGSISPSPPPFTLHLRHHLLGEPFLTPISAAAHSRRHVKMSVPYVALVTLRNYSVPCWLFTDHCVSSHQPCVRFTMHHLCLEVPSPVLYSQ